MGEKMIEEYLARKRTDQTRKTYRTAIRKFLNFVFGKDGDIETLAQKYFSEQRNYASDLERFLIKLREENRPPKTIRTYNAAVKDFLERAGGVEFSKKELRNIRDALPRGSKAATEKEVLTIEKLKSILKYADARGKALFLFMATSGLRVGEALSLTFDDVNLRKRPASVFVRREYTKSGEPRTTFISSEAVEFLKDYLSDYTRYLERANGRAEGLRKFHSSGKKGKENLAELQRLINRWLNPADERDYREATEKLQEVRIFPISTSLAQAMWKNCVQKAGLWKVDRKTRRSVLNIHRLRSFFRSRLTLSLEVDIVEQLMGHTGYLTEYRQREEDELARYYLQGEQHLLIYSKPTVDKIEMIKSFARTLGIENLDIKIARMMEESDLTEEEAIGRIIRQELMSDRINHAERKIITEDELESYLANGWEIEHVVNSKIVVRR